MIKRDPRLSLVLLVLSTALIVGSFLVGFIHTVITLVVIAAIYLFFARPKKVSTDPNKRRRKKKMKTAMLIIFLLLAIVGTVGTGIFFYYIAKNAPAFEEDKMYKQETSIVYDSAGDVIAKLGKEKRQKITFEKLPQVLIDAVVATEDSRYFQHNGFDLPRFSKAAFGQLIGKPNAGGGSTITMQVVKNTLTSTNQNVVRKFTDIYEAVFVLEKKYTKKEIFELYVNIPYLGSSSYGVEEASHTYFGKSVDQLTLSEAALIAGLFQSPSAYDPYNHPQAAENRRTTVLHLMKLHGYITADEEELANSIPVADLLVSDSAKIASTNPYQAYIDMVVAEVSDKIGTTPYDTAMEIYTTMNRAKQDALTTAINGVTFKDDYAQVGMAMTDTKTGAVVAIYGGRNKTGERTFNYAVDLKRQIGSTAKPIYDYGPGIEYLNWNELTPFVDEPWAYSDGTSIKNWDGKYMGSLTLEKAMGLSRNIAALKAFQMVQKEVGNEQILEFALGLGMSPEIAGGKIYETHSVGAYVGESPLTMAAAYAAFGNGGYYIKPYSITKIIYKSSGEKETFKPKKSQAMSDSTAYMITDCLVWNVNYGMATRAKVSGIEIAGKTGTTNFDAKTKAKYNFKGSPVNDLWLMVYSPSYTLGMWYGYDEISSEHYSVRGDNRTVTATAVKAVFTEKGDKFTIPDSVVKIEVEAGTNPPTLPSPFTPATKLVSAWFKKGAEPTEISTTYNALNNVSNLNASFDNGNVTLSWSHDISSALSTYLSKYGSEVGTVGYNVYKKTATGTLTLLGFTTDKSYTIEDVATATTYVVKSTFSSAQTTESSGTTITATPPTFNLELEGNNPYQANLYENFASKDPGVAVTDLNNNPLTGYTLNETITNSSGTIVSITEFTKTVGTYTATYRVTYAGTFQTVTREIKVK